jgi:hypothetical protein
MAVGMIRSKVRQLNKQKDEKPHRCLRLNRKLEFLVPEEARYRTEFSWVGPQGSPAQLKSERAETALHKRSELKELQSYLLNTPSDNSLTG